MTVTSLTEAASLRSGSQHGRYRVLVVEPQEVIQIGLRALFGSREWVDRCLVTEDRGVAMGIARRHAPHLALVSMQLGIGESGLQLCTDLRAAVPTMRILLLTSTGSVDGRQGLAAGADAVALKSAPATQLLRTGLALLEGRRVARPLLNAGEPSHRLSPRESQVLEKLSAGLSNPEIAACLHLSPNTVKQHTSALYRKLGVKNRAQAARLASAHGLVA